MKERKDIKQEIQKDLNDSKPECKVVDFQEWYRQKILKQIIERGNPLDKNK